MCKSREIAAEIIEFTQQKAHTIETGYEVDNIEFYSYFGDYDWVAFCWLFGRMIDLPKGFPMLAFDLQQYKYDKLREHTEKYGLVNINDIEGWQGHQGVSSIEEHPNYPKQTNEHNALADAKWNYELYKFLNTL